MFLNTLKILFITSAFLFPFLLILHKYYMTKVKDNVKISNYVAFTAVFLVIYIIGALLLAIITGGIKYKLLMIFFALCPFIIGKIAKYEKIRLYSSIQIMIMLFSAAVVCLH